MSNRLPVILIFDVGKTNKKILLFDQSYNVVFETSETFEEIADEDGFPCEDLAKLTAWVNLSFQQILANTDFNVKAINFSGYGASFVHVDDKLEPILPLYSYLKPYPDHLSQKFYSRYGGQVEFARACASPVLGNLNSGMQIFRLKEQDPENFKRIKFSLHVPQYLSSILTGMAYSEITSIGCHTNLWDFSAGKYHHWVNDESVIEKLAPLQPADHCIHFKTDNASFCVGVGMHDSSAALVPYLTIFKDPFILMSTGTWSISLNPFNDTELTVDELQKDCLFYLTHQHLPVKASRLFAGHEHGIQAKRIAEHFHVKEEAVTHSSLADEELGTMTKKVLARTTSEPTLEFSFSGKALDSFKNYTDAYKELMLDIVSRQIISTRLVMGRKHVSNLFVDGGFSKNVMFMRLLAGAFPGLGVSAASLAQASALGAALVLRRHWNPLSIPENLIQLQRYR